APVLLDVREDWERELSSIPGSLHLALASIREHGGPADVGMFDEESEQMPEDIVIHRQYGVRSAEAVGLHISAAPPGVRLRALAGGITAWSVRDCSSRAVRPRSPARITAVCMRTDRGRSILIGRRVLVTHHSESISVARSWC